MNLLTVNQWEIAAAAVVGIGLLALGLWLIFHKRPTAEELERARRKFLAHSGRLVDGMLLDVCEVFSPAQSKKETDRTLTMLLYSYRIGGVDYESSQDITDMSGVIDAAQVRAGFPCSARYQPGNPHNSIVVAEEWSGLREGLPVFPSFDDPDPVDRSHLESLRPGRRIDFFTKYLNSYASFENHEGEIHILFTFRHLFPFVKIPRWDYVLIAHICARKGNPPMKQPLRFAIATVGLLFAAPLSLRSACQSVSSTPSPSRIDCAGQSISAAASPSDESPID